MTQGMPAAGAPVRSTAGGPGSPAGVLWTFRVATALELASLLAQALTVLTTWLTAWAWLPRRSS